MKTVSLGCLLTLGSPGVPASLYPEADAGTVGPQGRWQQAGSRGSINIGGEAREAPT